MIGQTVSHYKIIEKLGEGGMGVVYKAQDTKLDRLVALKFLPSHLTASDEEKARFLQEAKAASALNHPNVCTIYGIEDHEGQQFIEMEYIDGEMLESKIHGTGLKIQDALTYALQIGEASAEAHAKGIIHRDIKSSNIMVNSKNQIKVMDFGLAKLKGSLKLTRTSSTIGTLAYMSPEQVQGEEADARSDIFSFGVVLYEMLTGRLPFRAEHEAAMMYSILNETPDPVSNYRSDLPEKLLNIIEGAMRKDPKDRYQNMTDLLTDLRKPGIDRGVTADQSIHSIAVLAFEDMSPEKNQDYFCEGLAEEIINSLTQIKKLRVSARTSAFAFKGKQMDLREIGRKLNVQHVLEGSVRKAGDRLRVTAQLITVDDGYHVWSERYDRELKDVFKVQDDITVAVVEALKVTLLGEEQGAVLKRHTRNPEAHEFYLRGLHYFYRFSPDDFQKASESFRRAIAIDPRYASAYAGLADAYTELCFFSFSPSEAMPKAREAANKALELDDRLGEAHKSLAIIKMYFDWDYAGAEQEFKRAIALNPGSALIHMWYGWYLGLMGRFDESFKEMQGAQELDPLSAANNSGIGIVFHWSRQPERAIEQFRKVLELNPDYPIACSFLAEAYEQKGDFVSAIATIKKIQQAATDPLTLSTVGYVYAKSGDRQKALEILNEFGKQSNQEYVPALNFAQIYAGLGDNEQALAWLDKACNERAIWIPFLKVDLKFDPLRSNPRFQGLLKKAGFEK